MSGNSARPGVRNCKDCRRQFTVTVGTVFEDSHIPMRKWVLALFLLCSSKKGMSSLQLQRILDLGSYKTASFMTNRIRYAMKEKSFAAPLSGVVEMDETYCGGKGRPGTRKPGRPGKDSGKTPVVTIVERDGTKRSMVMERITTANLGAAVAANVIEGSSVMTDAYPAYVRAIKKFDHHSVNHSAGEYARRDGNIVAHTNTVESSFSLLKRGIYGTFHSLSRKHLHRYLAEFDFRWNHRKTTDGERTVAAIRGVSGKRLTYRQMKGVAA
jgi:hypothetical protein